MPESKVPTTAPRSRRGARLAAVVATMAGITLVGIGPAAAHVTVNPDSATAGSYSVLTFRVPNESAKASTVGLTVTFPLDHPFASVSVRKQPGWTSTATRSKLATPITDDDNASITEAVSSITWKADPAGSIVLGEFAEFEVSVGPVPKATSMSFPADQLYSDGTVVKWNEPTPASGAEPEHPAPTLSITPAGSAGAAGSAGSAGAAGPGSAPATVTVSAAATGSPAAPSDSTARTLAVVGVVLAALALLLGAVAVRRNASRR